MNGHCGITGSTYRPVERSTYVKRMEPESDPFGAARWLLICLLTELFISLGVIVGAAMGVKL